MDRIVNTFYVDFDRIRKHGGYVYWWDMVDYLKPNRLGSLSVKNYIQGDCKLFRYKNLSQTQIEQPMGGGTGKINNFKNPEWNYSPPDSSSEIILKSVCSR
jgi:hypothetical protein